MNKKALKQSIKIAVPYLLLGGAYIIFSDSVVNAISKSNEMVTELQTYKGWGFIVLTALLLLILLYRYFNKLELEKTNLEESEERWKSLVSNSPDFIALLDEQGRFLYLNKYAEGFTEQDVIGTSTFDMMIDESKDLYKKQMQGCITTWTTKRFEFLAYGDNKSIRTYEEFLVPIKNKKQEINLLAVARDITESNRAEEDLKLALTRLRQFVDANIVGVIIADASGAILEANDYYLDMIGYTRKELEDGKVDWRSLTPQEWLFTDEKALVELNETGTCTPYEKEYIRRDGTRVAVYLADAMLPGEDKKIAAFALNITDRKRFEAELISSEERYRSLFENMSEGFAYCKMLFKDQRPDDFVYLKTNPRFNYLTGLKNVEGKKVTEVIPGIRESNPELFEIYGKVSLSGEPVSFETYLVELNDWYSVSVYSPKKEYFVAVFDVITDRKQTELALIKNRRLLADLIENSGTLIFVKDLEGRYELVNKKWETITGIDRYQVLGKTDEVIFPGPIGLQFRKNDLEVLQNEKVIETEEVLSDDQGKRYFISIKFPTLDENGVVNGICGMSTEITERKLAEEELRLSRQQFQSYFDLGAVGMSVTAPDKTWIEVNQKLCEMFGYSKNELQGISWEMLSYPDDIRINLDKFNQVIDGKIDSYEIDKRFIKKDGKIIYVALSVFCQRNKDGSVNHFLSSYIDITSRKIAEEALRESEAKYRTITENMKDVVWILDINTEHFTYVSPSVFKLRGYTPEEIISENFSEALTKESTESLREITVQRINEFLSNKGESKYYIDQVEQPCKDGSTVWTEVVTNFHFNELTGHTEVHGVTRDLTKRKKIQDALIKSEERFSSTLNNMLEGCQILDTEWKYIYLNDAAERQNRRDKKELLGNRFMDMWPAIENTYVYKVVKDCMENKTSHQFEFEFTFSDGYIRWFDLSIQPVPEGVFILSIDITEKKKVEQTILTSREQLRALAASLEKVREEERIHLSRELHDHLGQNLTGLKMDVAYVAKHLKSDPDFDEASLLIKTNGMVELIDDLIKNVRKISGELRPNVLDYLGLIPAIEWQIEEFKKRTEIECVYNSNTSKIDIGMQINSSIFRIMQEAFTNIIRHSEATKVILNIVESEESILIEIQDNGIGIKETEISNVSSLGILGMMERTLNFNGKLNIKNVSTGGTLLSLTIPKRS